MGARRARALGTSALLVAVTGTACATAQEAAEDAKEVRSDSREFENSDDQSVIGLADGRKVRMRYADGRGLVEQHQASGKGKWSAPRTIYRTETEPCQGIKLRAHGTVVAAIADFALYCRDGEPPQESVAAVAEGDLSRWDVDLTKATDGWPRARFLDKGNMVRFVDNLGEGKMTLLWSPDDGFAKTTVWKPIRKSFLGTWRAEDGSHRVTFTQAGKNPPSATITTADGRCKAHGDVEMIGDAVQLPIDMEVQGKKAEFCPTPDDGSPHNFEFTGPDNALQLTTPEEDPDALNGYSDKVLATYERAE